MTLQEASLNLTEAEYRQYPCLSYSNLQQFDRNGYECLDTLFDPFTTPSLVFGSLVDCLLTQGNEAFNESYAIMDVALPPESVMNIVSQLCESHTEKQFALISDDDIVLAADSYEYQKSWKDATRVSKIRNLGSAYYNFMKANDGKTLVSKQDVEDAQKAANLLRSDPATGWYFSHLPFEDTERLYQLQFTTVDSVTGIEYKGMLDLVIVDHKNKRIYPCDLKTTKSIYTFEDSFYKYRYYLQAAMYTELLRKVIADKCPELADYTIEPYRFIVISRSNFKPVVFEWNQLLDIEGYTDPQGKTLSNWRDLLIQLHWALDNKETQLPKPWSESMRKDGFIRIKRYPTNV